MRALNLLHRIRSIVRPRDRHPDTRRQADYRKTRVCRFESFEPRILLAADLQLGAVYFEEATGDDSRGDVIQVTYEGGADQTQLTRLVIDGDKRQDGLTDGDVFFDTQPGGNGAFGAVDLVILEQVGFDVTGVTVVDGGTQIAFDLSGFDPGEKLLFSIDVDEAGFVDGDLVESTSVVEGGEFQRSRLSGLFQAPHHESLELNAVFWDAFDSNFADSAAASRSTLDLPPDRYLANNDLTDRTAGAVAHAPQVPLPITISGTVFADQDLDNHQDSGDHGIPDVQLTLWVHNPATDAFVDTGKSTSTDGQGHYELNSNDGTVILPGRYEIRETQPAGYFSVGATAGTVDGSTRGVVVGLNTISQIDLLGGQDSIDNDFAEALPASLSGYVYHDADNDAVRDAGEEGIPNVAIELIPVTTVDGSSDVIRLQTDANGFYNATGLAPGEYQAVEPAQPNGYLDGLDAAGTVDGLAVGSAVNPGDAIHAIRLAGGQAGTEYNFGELLPSTIQGRVHASTDGDCLLGPNDILLAGVRVDLLDANGSLISTTVTDSNGSYRFDGLAPGTYQVFEHQPEAYFDGDEHVGTAGGQTVSNDAIRDIQIRSGTVAADYNFCEHVGVTLSGYVYYDQSNDGQFDTNESGIGAVTLRLLDAEGRATGATSTTSTAANNLGYYEFTNLAAGTYGVAEVQPAGYLDGLDSPGNQGGQAENPGDRITGAVLAWGSSGEQYNFGELLPSSISGIVHASTDGDCILGPDDILLEGVQVDLFDAGGSLVTSAFTDNLGRYRFDGLAPGTYQVVEHQPAGYFNGDQHVGTAGGTADETDRISGIQIRSGVTAVDYDFCEHVGVNLSGYVYHDVSNDGIFDAKETGIGGVTLMLLDAAGSETGQTTTTRTDAGNLGFYQWTDLAPGTYGVAEVQPAGYLDGLDTPGTRGGTAENPGDRILGAALAFGHSGANYNFGELLPSSISGRVHASTDGDCVLDPHDIPLGDVQIDLFDEAGRQVATTRTDADGVYQFNGLAPGRYRIVEHQPAGYADGDEHVGTAGGQSDQDDSILGIELISGTTAVDYDFCEHVHVDLSGFVYHDADNDGVFDDEETGIGQVTLRLLDADGNETGATAISSAALDQLGFYQFTSLTPGTYGVAEVQPAGYLDGLDTPGNRGGTAANPGDAIRGVVLQFGLSGEDYNFGELLPGSISGRVHSDPDQDCLLDEGESPIEGVVIELYNGQGDLVSTTTTNAEGQYAFTGLRPGSYTVRELQPETFFDGQERVGTAGGDRIGNDTIAAIQVGSGQHVTDYNFCEIPPATISGSVFQDGAAIRQGLGEAPEDVSQFSDGKRTPDDRPLPGVRLELRHGVSGLPILAAKALPGVYAPGPIQTTTDSTGYYEFRGLPPGNYAVFEVHPSGFVDGIDTPGSLGGLAVNRHAPVNPLVLSQLAVDPADDAILRIALPAGQHSINNDFSEVRVEPFWFPDLPDPEAVPAVFAPVDVTAPTVSFIPLAALDREALETYGSSGRVIGYTWHLSVIDGGWPRAADAADRMVHLTGSRFDAVAWRGSRFDQSVWTFLIIDQQGHEIRHRSVFGAADATPVTGDFNGDGVTEQGVFAKGEWFIDLNGNGQWDESDLWIKLGHDGDLPLTGDWDGDGKTDIGVFGRAWPGDPHAIAREPGLPDPENAVRGRLKNVPPPAHDAAMGARTMKLTSQGTMRSDLIDHVFHFGTAGDRPVAGDWNGDGIETIGVFRNGHWHLDTNGDGKWTEQDGVIRFGSPDDIPVVGDWDGNGVDQVGVYRNGTWLIDSNGNRQLDARDRVFQLGSADDLPVVGDFDGDGIDQAGLYHKGGETTTVARPQASGTASSR